MNCLQYFQLIREITFFLLITSQVSLLLSGIVSPKVIIWLSHAVQKFWLVVTWAFGTSLKWENS